MPELPIAPQVTQIRPSPALVDLEMGKFADAGNGTASPGTIIAAVRVTPAPGSSFGASSIDQSVFNAGTTTGGIAMGVYQGTPSTISSGSAAAIGIDENRNSKVREQYAPSYEDNTLGIAKVNQVFSYNAVITADAQIKGAAGFLHCVTLSCNDAAPTAGTLIIYDSLTETGTQIFNCTFTTTPFNPLTIMFNCNFGTGLYAGFTTTADVNISISYR